MLLNLTAWLLAFFRTTSQILTAGIAITAFALLLYALAFNLRDRVARSFAAILVCVIVVFTGEAIGSTTGQTSWLSFWLHFQWVGIIFLPPAYLHFSDALLATTGKPSRWRRFWAVRISYLISAGFLFFLVIGVLLGPVVNTDQPAPHLQRTFWTDVFTLYYLGITALSWINFIRAYRRTTTPTSQRRMGYLLLGAVAPTVGSFPFLLFGSELVAQHPLFFWSFSALSNLVLGGLVVVMAYAVAFFGVSWPDRAVKSRLFKWILRGPVSASLTLGITTVVRRAGELFGQNYTPLVPILMVVTILVFQYLITVFSPWWERVLFSGQEREDLSVLRRLEDHFMTQNDLTQFLEMILAAVCDRLQASGAMLAVMEGGELDWLVRVGNAQDMATPPAEALQERWGQNGVSLETFQWGPHLIVPLENDSLMGLMVVANTDRASLDREEVFGLNLLVERAALALHDRRSLQQILGGLQTLSSDMDMIQRMRAVGRYDGSVLLQLDVPEVSPDLAQSVKEALTHYWGGPKLTESALVNLKVVQDSLDTYDGNRANAVRGVLREAIERVRPEGERRFTGEWILYNILEMKFLEGRKVREVAMRLAMSEADLYRKQRVAIEAVARAVTEMEALARVEMPETENLTPQNPPDSE